MSYQRRLQAHYNNLIHAVCTISLPTWVTGRTVRVGLMGMVMFLSVAYLLQINSAATRGYEAHELEKQVTELSTQVQNLEIKIADAGSMNNIQKRLQNMNLVTAEQITRYNAKAVVAMAK